MSPQAPADKWPLGVFASIDAGFGVRLEVAQELGVPTMHLHAPHQTPRTQDTADQFRQRIDALGMRVTVVFAGFDGESYADIPTTKETIGLAPVSTRQSAAGGAQGHHRLHGDARRGRHGDAHRFCAARLGLA